MLPCGVSVHQGHVDWYESTFRYCLLDDVNRHPAPAKARQQKIETSSELDKPPSPFSGKAVVGTIRIDRIGQHELHMGRQVVALRRASQGGERMVARGHSLQLDAHQRKRDDVVRHDGQ